MLFSCLCRPARTGRTLLLAGLLLACPGVMSGVQAEPTVPLTAAVPPAGIVKKARLLGPVSSTQRLRISLTLPARDPSGLETLLQRLYDPSDTLYHKFLSSADFNARFAPTQADYDALAAFAQSKGFVVAEKHSGRSLLSVTATCAALQTAFGVKLNRYALADGTEFYANDVAPRVPQSLAQKQMSVLGLSNLSMLRRPKSRPAVSHLHRFIAAQTASPKVSPKVIGSGPGGGLIPTDIKAAYNLKDAEIPDGKGGSLNGSGQVLGLYQLDGYTRSNIDAYTTKFNLGTANLVNVLVDGFSGQVQDTNSEFEVTLDIEMMLALAPKAQILVYEGMNGTTAIYDLFLKIADDNLAKSVSSSWGIPETYYNGATDPGLATEDGALRKMAAQGQSFFVASGDLGAFDDTALTTTPVIDDPTGQPFATGVGGTTLSVTAPGGTWTGEIVWSNTTDNSGGGGGISMYWPRPYYQNGDLVNNVQYPDVGVSKTKRNVPDVSLNADNRTGYYVYLLGDNVVGGTSAAAPLWGAFMGLVNQRRSVTGDSTVGFVNPIIYKLNSNKTSYAASFHDITTGTNLFYAAGVGYDNATGWGSFIGGALIKALSPAVYGPNGAIAGTVKSSNGQPIVGATVTVVSVNRGSINVSTTTDSKGVYYVKVPSTIEGENPESITYSVSVDAPNYAGRTVLTLANGDSITVVKDQTTIVDFRGVGRSHVFSKGGLQMIAAPFDYSNTADYAALFGFPSPLRTGIDPRLAIWQASLNSYVYFPQAPADTLRPGYGYWANLSSGNYVHREGVPVPTNQSYRVSLQAGWNQIGDPFPVAVPISSLRLEAVTTGGSSASSTAVTGPLYSYPGGSSTSYTTVSGGGSIQPYLGYWIYVSRASTLVVPPPAGL